VTCRQLSQCFANFHSLKQIVSAVDNEIPKKLIQFSLHYYSSVSKSQDAPMHGHSKLVSFERRRLRPVVAALVFIRAEIIDHCRDRIIVCALCRLTFGIENGCRRRTKFRACGFRNRSSQPQGL
jgi:hypothetical protein